MSPPKSLPTRQLGKDGPQVPQLGFGLMELSIGYGATIVPDSERLAVLDRAWSLGATFWDTAAGYGDNEVLIGNWLKIHPERRNDIFLGTKFGGKAVRDEDGKVRIEIDSSKENCRAVCEQSLRNLGVECIDLFYVHRFDGVTPVEKTMEAMVELKREGKIKHIGFSECSSGTLRRGYAIHPIAAVQIEFNPWTLDIESEAGTNLLSTCRALGVATVTYSPLGRGFMTGRYKSLDDLDEKDTRRQLPRFSPENFSKNLDLVKIFQDLAAKKFCTPAQVVLAWIMAQGTDFFPIPGTKTIKYLEQNLGAVELKISEEENRYIRDAVEAVGGAVGNGSIASGNMFADTPPL